MRTIGANIRYYRCLHHLTQEKLAELADINEKSISAYENDTRIPPIFTLLEIAQALGVTMEQLCGVAGPKTIEDELLDRIRMEVKLVLTEYKIDKIDKIDTYFRKLNVEKQNAVLQNIKWLAEQDVGHKILRKYDGSRDSQLGCPMTFELM